MEDSQVPKKRAFNESVLKLGLVSFFADVASEMLYPVTPLFLTAVLGASMFSVGLIEGVSEGLASLLKVFSGAFSDSLHRRKPFIVVGYFLGAISKPLIGLSLSWTQVFGARSLDRVGKGIRSAPRDALIADSVDPSMRGAAFGLHRGMDTLGAALGPLLTVMLLGTGGAVESEKLRSIYFWALIPGILSVLVIAFIHESGRQSKQKRQVESPLASWRRFDPSLKRYVYAWGIFCLANSSDVFLLMKAKAAGFSNQSVVLLYCFYNLTYALSSPFLGHLSDRISKMTVMIWGLVIYVLVYLLMGFAVESWHHWVLFLVYGLYMGATEGVGKALALDLAPDELKATCVGVLGAVGGVCTIFASLSAGILWDKVGPHACFFYGALGASLACACMATIQIPKKQVQPKCAT